MSPLRIVTVLGARPQFIKAAPVSRALKLQGELDEVLIHTGQHHDENMSDVFFRELEIPPPKHNLGVHSGRHGAMTGQMLEKVEEVLIAEAPDWVLVYGDTNSTLAGALAAAKLHIPVAHIEAGLRSFNRLMPEEVNRVLTDHVSELLFAPTEIAIANLRREGIADPKVHLVGDVMYDAATYFGARRSGALTLPDGTSLPKDAYVLVTIHRAENTDDPDRLSAIASAIQELAKAHLVVLPLHPRTRGALSRLKMLEPLEGVGRLKLIEPVGYLDMVVLERNAKLILTDSGGVQKEAYFHRVPCVTLRDETEWVELVDMGWNRLCPATDVTRILASATSAIGSRGSEDQHPYGQGNSATLIAQILAGASKK